MLLTLLLMCAPQSGTYLRNGPGLWDVGGGGAFHHLFDGYATLVRVSFRQGRATGAHRQIESDAYVSAVESGGPVLLEFSQCPKPGNMLERVSNAVGILSGAALTDNPNAGVLPLGDGRVLCLTESTKSSVLVDPETLATVGKFRYADGLGSMMMMIQSGHPIVTESELLTADGAPRPRPPGPPRRQDGGRERQEGGDWQSGLPRGADPGVDALVRRHGELRRRAGDAAPVLGQQTAQGRARPVLRLRVAPGVRQLHARHVQVHREDGKLASARDSR